MISVGADGVVKDLALELGCKVEQLPIKYLGLPLGATARCASVWDEVVQRMEVKLASWKKKEHLSFNINNGKSLRFWQDNWTSGGILKERFPASYKACNTKLASVEEMIQNGRLHYSSRRNLSAMEQLEWDLLCNEMGHVHGLNEEEDTVEFLGGFSVKKCYELQVQDDPVGDFNKFLWKKRVPPKVSFMLWDYFHDSLPTLTMLRHRGMDLQSVNCVFCNAEVETTDHMFLHCDYAFKVWSKFLEGFGIDWVASVTVWRLFEAWKLNNVQGRGREIWWKLIYAVL
ncbi:uncharacterized protein LOC113294330 [Papaver somniferum]|uniref:uncharacterized protein LOC113294330 n=1 Tax=Papaver somniferum TaxID=3469 RepID=UPI000E6F823E|nr:uncharacterized protein LOC113294330 [Papaver somniferum]